MLANGSMKKIVKIPFCDFCNALLKDVITLCSSCQRKICSSCVVIYKDKNYCRKCAAQLVSLTKEHCMVLLGIAQEVNLKKIEKFSRISSENLRKSLLTLLERDLIERRGLSVFAHCIATHKGLSLLPMCQQIYQSEGDFQHFIMEVKNFLRGKL